MFVGRFVVLGAYVSAITFMPMSIGERARNTNKLPTKAKPQDLPCYLLGY